MHHRPSPVTCPVCQQQQYEINLPLATPLTEFEGATLASGNISLVNAQGTLFTPFASGAVQVVPQPCQSRVAAPAGNRRPRPAGHDATTQEAGPDAVQSLQPRENVEIENVEIGELGVT